MIPLLYARPRRSRNLRTLLLSGILLVSALLAVSQAQITLDGSLGPRGPLAGPIYRIGAELRQIRGGNLFHSFGEFSVPTGGSATFSGPNTIANILGRVTGGQPSFIDGLLRSEITGANLFLLNPSGIMFGPNASLDVSGSFHVSTADFLRLADGATFSAHLGQASALTVAAPAAFRFLGSELPSITIEGSSLQVPVGSVLSVVGGDITMVGGRISSGRLLLAGMASPGEVVLNPSASAIDSFAYGSRIALSQGALISTSSTSDGSVGDVVVRGERVTLTNGAQIVSSNSGVGRGGDVTIIATDTITIAGRNSGLFTNTRGRGPGGHLQVRARTIELRDGGTIAARSSGEGDAGMIRLQAGETFRSQNGTVTTTSNHAGGGAITLTAGRLVQLLDSELSTSVRGGGGDAGNITIKSAFLVLAGSQVIADAFGGMGGNTLLFGTEVFLVDQMSGVSASSTLGIGGFAPPLSGALIPLPQTFMSVAALLPVRCAARASGGRHSSLVLGGRDGLPDGPSGVLASPLVLEERLVADPAMIGGPPRPSSTPQWALLAGHEKRLPRLGCPQG